MRKIYFIPIVLLVFACNSMKKSPDTKIKKTDLFTTLYSSSYSGRDTASSLIIKNQAELDALFESVNSEERPKVDFSNNQVIALFLGQKNSGGYSISIDRVEEEEGKVIVHQKVETPKAGENVTMALTNPLVVSVIYSKKVLILK